ncbi:hypothetical protein GCM10025772_00990 [Ferrimonas gelatinilytica]|uniref:Uncharacterized protein n=2 Tax=Ferrimonas gelatinilytica TaxID=1255257 RepID=A0ABP9RSV3_9GAMM
MPNETDDHIFVELRIDGSYYYQGDSYNAKELSKVLMAQFWSGEISSKKLEIHCLKHLKLSQLEDFFTFAEYKIKPVGTKDFKFTSECSGNDAKWTFDN